VTFLDTKRKSKEEDPEQIEFFGISVYSYEYASIFTVILGLFLLTRGLVAIKT